MWGGAYFGKSYWGGGFFGPAPTGGVSTEVIEETYKKPYLPDILDLPVDSPLDEPFVDIEVAPNVLTSNDIPKSHDRQVTSIEVEESAKIDMALILAVWSAHNN